MSRARKLRIAWLIWAVALLTNSTLWFVSNLENYTYAGPLGFIAITDGYIALPFTLKKTWGDWGWFSQEPWYTDTSHPNDYPWPINYDKRYYHVHAPAIVIRFAAVNIALIFVALPRFHRALRRSRSLSLLAASIVFFGLYVPMYLRSYRLPISLPIIWAVLQYYSLTSLNAAVISHRASLRGLCPTCRYNLTGNTSGVCPECGSATPTEPIRTADV